MRSLFPRAPVTGRHAVFLLALGTLPPATTSCRSCEEDRPYTPFQMPSGALHTPDVPDGSGDPSRPADPPPFEPTEMPALPEADQRQWRVDDLHVRPPRGHRLDRGAPVDLDGDGQTEVLVWAVPDEPGQARGALWLHRRRGPPVAVTRVPPFVPSGPDCTAETRLWHSGPRTVTLEVRARCEAPRIARAPVGALIVVQPMSERPELLTLRLAEPAPGETLTLEVDSRDRDADGRDDVRLVAALHTGTTEHETRIELAWLDRAAGLARDATQPRKGFEEIGSIEVVRAKGSTTSRATAARVENARRLYASLCAESGVPRLFDGDGNPLPCGDLRQAFEWYAEAEITAAVTRKQPLTALGAWMRRSWYHGPLGEKAEKRLLALLGPAVASSPAEARELPVRARERGSGPRWSPLRFDADGSLLVMTASGMERFDPSGQPLGAAEEEVDPWPLTVIGSDGKRWNGAAFTCDRSEALFLWSSPEGIPLPAEPIGLLSPRPGGCKGGAFPDLLPPTPLVWEGDRRVALVAGNAVAPLGQKDLELPPGHWFAAGSPIGLLVFSRSSVRRWEVPRAGELGDCAVSPGGARVACVRGASAVILVSGPALQP
jgi:hypothetical protein